MGLEPMNNGFANRLLSHLDTPPYLSTRTAAYFDKDLPFCKYAREVRGIF